MGNDPEAHYVTSNLTHRSSYDAWSVRVDCNTMSSNFLRYGKVSGHHQTTRNFSLPTLVTSPRIAHFVEQ